MFQKQTNEDKLLVEVERQLAELNKLRNYEGADEVIPLEGAALRLRKATTPPTIYSGIPFLDQLLKGFEAGEMIVISGPTKNGKTTFAQTLTANMGKKGVQTLWFSYEMPMRQFIPSFGEMPKEVFVPQELKSSALLWIKSKILEGILKYQVKAVFIDHLGFLQDVIKKQDRRIEIDEVVRSIKCLAMELDVTIFLIHHIRKIEPGAIPSYEDLKESSSIAQDADKVLMIWREFTKKKDITFTGNTILSIELDRREGVYKKHIKLILKNKRFEELTTVYDNSIPTP